MSEEPTLFSGEVTQTGEPTGDPSPASAVLDPGTTIGRYTVLQLLGRGGMGVVYAVYDPKLDRKIALKLLRPSRKKKKGDDQARLLREAQALAKIAHPNVIVVHDVGVLEGRVFVAMEYLDGTTLERWQRNEGGREWPEVLEAYVQAARGLAAAHKAGLVHRDFKPENAFIDEEGRVRVLDFGLARAQSDKPTGAQPIVPESDELEISVATKITREGAVVGTPAYMPPEQFLGGEVDERSDQFSFCVALYEALYGERPFKGESASAVLFNAQLGKVNDATKQGADVPTWLRSALVRGLSAKPDERWPSMEALLAELTADRVSGKRNAALGAAVIAAVVAVGWGISRGPTVSAPADPCAEAKAWTSETWTDERSKRVHDAIAAAPVPYARDVASSVRDKLGAYALALDAGHLDACEDVHVRKEHSEALLDLRNACLERRRMEFETFASALEEVDAKGVERAVEGASSLSAVDACADLGRLQAAPPLPADEAARREVAAIRAELSKLRGARQAGHLPEQETLDALRARGEAAGYGPVQAEVEEDIATVHHAAGKTDESILAAEKALWLGLEHRADEIAAEAAAGVYVGRGYGRREKEGVEVWEQLMASTVARAGSPRALVSLMFRSRATVEFGQGKYELALIDYLASLSLTDPERVSQVSLAYSNLGNVHIQLERFDEALVFYTRALDLAVKEVGPNHPLSARAYNNKAIAYQRLERWDEAERAIRRSLDVKKALYGEDHPSIAASLGNLANNLAEKGDHRGAHEAFAAARKIFEKHLPPGHPFIAICWKGQAIESGELGEIDRGLEELDAAKAMVEARGEGPVELARYEAVRVPLLGARDPKAARKLAKRVLEQLAEGDSPEAKESTQELEEWLAENGG